MFSACDLLRIAKVVEHPEERKQALCYFLALDVTARRTVNNENDLYNSRLSLFLESLADVIAELRNLPEGVGGGMGGGGSTGTFSGKRPRWWIGDWP